MGLRLTPEKRRQLYAPITSPSPLVSRGILDKPKQWYEEAKEEVEGFYEGGGDVLEGIGSGIGGLYGEIFDEAGNKIEGFYDDIIEGGSNIAEGIGDFYEGIFHGAKDMFGNVLGGGGDGGGGAGINQIPLNPFLQAVVDSARKQQIGALDKLEEITKEDLGVLNQKSLERQQLQRELGLIPKETTLTRTELAATTGIEDARRKLRERIAQRGLGTSSIGLAQEEGLRRKQADLFQDIKAQRAGLAKERELGKKAIDVSSAEQLRERRLADVQRRAGIAGGILSQPGVQPGVTIQGGQSDPGLLSSLLPIIGAGVGGYMGGSGGATVGYGIGQSAGGLLQNRNTPTSRRRALA